ncbi:cell wall hydrolase [Alkalihalobacterium chitinilyticum]|uniref:Cell wall hydrolase n=1 Tax=Alkalihalobacterium chitinilyticum TaxID=2980103 RepID=A0ABT5VD61_9BACI|nr:cell wall hydrolase [Alkalihalobacterium chitinilyticum]MDE5413389.1 cell wall hydrolase [Alkalihalobacterium chitinilyticum]
MLKKAKLFLPVFVCLLIVSLFPKESQAYEFTLQKEDRSQQVFQLQEKLVQLGYLHVAPTGYYGTLTENAVLQLQQDFRLSVDGIAGPRTLHRLMEIEKMAKIVHGEARGEAYKGQVAVAAVIKNRLHSSEFPSTVEGVIYQRNAFTAVQDGQYDLTPTYIAYRAVKDAWLGWDPTYGSTYYYNPRIATSQWIFNNTTPKLTIGRHLFAD